MFAFEGCAQSSGWKLTRTGDTGACRILGDCPSPDNGFVFSPQSYLSAGGARSASGAGFRWLGLFEVDDVTGEVVTAAMAGMAGGEWGGALGAALQGSHQYAA